MLSWTQYIGQKFIVVTIHSNTLNVLRGMSDRLILSCERGRNYKNKKCRKLLIIEGLSVFFLNL